MEKIKINVKEREAGTPNQLRREAKIPATIYGQGEISQNLQVDEKEFKYLPAAAYSHIVELDFGGGKPTSALIKHVQRNAASNQILNVEFYKVKMDHKLTIVVPLKFLGTAGGVIKGGQLIESHMEAEIECFPNDIPDFIEVDLSKLEEIDDAIHFRDLQVSDKVKILNEPDDIVAKVGEIRETVEEEPTVAEATPVEGAEGTGEAAPAASGSGDNKAAAPAATKSPTSAAKSATPAAKEK